MPAKGNNFMTKQAIVSDISSQDPDAEAEIVMDGKRHKNSYNNQ